MIVGNWLYFKESIISILYDLDRLIPELLALYLLIVAKRGCKALRRFRVEV